MSPIQIGPSIAVAVALAATGCAKANQGPGDGGATDNPAVDGASLADAMTPAADGRPATDAAVPDAATPDATVDATPPTADATAPTCTADASLACGDIAQHSLLLADADIAGYGCATVPTLGVENIYEFTAPADGTVVLALDVLEDDPLFGDDFDLFVLTPQCSTTTCIAEAATAGDDTLTFEAISDQTYFIVVEGFAAGLLTFMNYDLQLTCL